MEFILHLIALLAVIIGTAFSIIGIIGLVRLPDVYTRLHATGKVSTFGVILLLIAAIAWTPLGLGKGLLLMLFLLVAGPVASHALSSAAYRLGIPMQATRDDLQKK
ncbi:MAG: monovalent cation/H(+) antiporter subunit G [Anaerolineales bacterium]|nr:monovalent cation/H(+) antiporter subunit G [Anaerolineales bacterium]